MLGMTLICFFYILGMYPLLQLRKSRLFPVSLFLSVSVCLSVSISHCLCLCLSVCLSLSHTVSLCVSVCLSLFFFLSHSLLNEGKEDAGLPINGCLQFI